jgi:hypothetical protein
MNEPVEIPDELKPLAKQWIGRKVLLVGDHPHADRVGIVNRMERAHAINKWGFIVRFDESSNDECFVFEGKHWRTI